MAQLKKNVCTLDACLALQRDEALKTIEAHYRDLWKLMETDWKAQDRPLVTEAQNTSKTNNAFLHWCHESMIMS